jgi:hypothetical protein
MTHGGLPKAAATHKSRMEEPEGPESSRAWEGSSWRVVVLGCLSLLHKVVYTPEGQPFKRPQCAIKHPATREISPIELQYTRRFAWSNQP